MKHFNRRLAAAEQRLAGTPDDWLLNPMRYAPSAIARAADDLARWVGCRYDDDALPPGVSGAEVRRLSAMLHVGRRLLAVDVVRPLVSSGTRPADLDRSMVLQALRPLAWLDREPNLPRPTFLGDECAHDPQELLLAERRAEALAIPDDLPPAWRELQRQIERAETAERHAALALTRAELPPDLDPRFL